MKHSLYDAQGNEIPPRPTCDDSLIKQSVMSLLSEGKFTFDIPVGQHESFADDIAKHASLDCDEYELSKEMDNEGWAVDKNFVEDMSLINGEVSYRLRNAVKEWFAQYNPVPPFEVGTVISIGYNRMGKGCGEITGIYEHQPAKYLVRRDGQKDDDNSRLLIAFEEASAYIEKASA
ncbi:hypothetical protein J4N45_10495 [Vibrio sp. SCSIO 43140]|uniref:hypothetical protein n=1 Tax=Vibrio sp. SCSIO 43140 TaxID=2819100 RepID=UPI00207588ED|nr:hypothetical protein [Vibrio sp. SCSIO 43140]USD58959.1 hypothetical protein J4N45_10495 [Vibrio sp. SCSIO 43140]